ncbi:MAG: hypothetical protein HWE08_04025 [Alphaproteobacteria bacterium]|nr:hypothetical protein [Alphaproteobacteria bacterium]
MKLQSLFAIGSLFLALVSAAQPAAATGQLFSVGNTDITVKARNEFCAFGNEHDFDQKWLNWQAKSNEGQNQLVGAYALCDELAQLRAGTPLNMSRWIILLAPTSTIPAKAQPVVGYTRAEFIEGVSKEFESGIDLDVDEVARRSSEALSETVGEKTDPIKLGGVGRPELLGKTDRGMYAALVLEVKAADRVQKVAGVIGITLVKQHAVSINVFRNYDEPDTINQLLLQAKDMVDYVVLAND